MRRLVVSMLAVAAAAAPLAMPSAQATTPVTYYFHGSTVLGEADLPNAELGAYFAMDATAPAGSPSKSLNIVNYGGGPNTHCAGNGLFPVWVGNATGTVTGDLTVTFNVASTGEKLLIRVWPDLGGLACNANYPTPAAQATVDVAAGQAQVKAVLKNAAGFAVTDSLMVQISPLDATPITPFFARMFYDGATDASSLSFTLA